MRGKQPEPEPFESPFARTILPQRGRSKTKGTGPDYAETPAVPPQAAPPQPAPTAAPAPALAGATFAGGTFTGSAFADAAGGPVAPPAAYPQLPGFGQPQLQPGNGQVVPAQGFAPPPTGFPAPIPGFPAPAPAAPPAFAPPAQGQGIAPLQAPQGFAPPQPAPQGIPAQGIPAPYMPAQGFAPTTSDSETPADGSYHPHHMLSPTATQDATDATGDAQTSGDGDGDDGGGKKASSKGPRPKKRLALLAIPLVVALAGAAYLYVPKLLNSSSSSSAPTVSFPARVGSFAKATDAKTVSEVQLAQRHMRAALPALANLQVALYGKTPDVMLGAELWPKGVAAKTPAEQAALVQQINKKLSTNGAPEKLARVALPAKPGELWCGFNPKSDTDPASTDCMYVDRYALVLTTIVGPDDAKNVAKAKLLVPLVERQA